MDHALEIAIGSAAGSALAIAIAKYAVQRGLRDIEKALEMCHSMTSQLSAIQVRLDNIEAYQPIIHDQEKRLNVLESRYIVRRRNDARNGQ